MDPGRFDADDAAIAAIVDNADTAGDLAGDDLPAGGLTDWDDAQRPRWRARRLRRGPWGRLAERWVPEPLRDARTDPGRRGALVFVSVAIIAGIVAAAAVWSRGPSPQPVAATALAPVIDSVSPSAAPDGDGATSGGRAPAAPPGVATAVAGGRSTPAGTADPLPPQNLVVSVTGRVAAPGLVTLPPGARVADAVAAAGGPTDAADLTGLNLAARLADGDSVVIGGTGHGVPGGGAPAGGSRLTGGGPAESGSQTGGASTAGAPGLLDLNTADQTALEELPGVGPVMAQAILTWRAEHGEFSDVGQLQEVSGIGPARYAQLQPLVTV